MPPKSSITPQKLFRRVVLHGSCSASSSEELQNQIQFPREGTNIFWGSGAVSMFHEMGGKKGSIIYFLTVYNKRKQREPLVANGDRWVRLNREKK